MSATLQQLRQDHANMARVLGVLEQHVNRLRSDSDPDYGLMEDIMHYMIHYADDYHHVKEDLVFARLARRDASSRATVDALEREHNAIAEQGARLYESVCRVEHDAVIRRDQIVEQALSYISTLRRHMNAEQTDVFPRAEQTLTPADWRAIDGRLKARDDPLFGELVAERYRQRYRQITQAVEGA